MNVLQADILVYLIILMNQVQYHQASDSEILQIGYISCIKELLCILKSVLKLQHEKRAHTLATINRYRGTKRLVPQVQISVFGLVVYSN